MGNRNDSQNKSHKARNFFSKITGNTLRMKIIESFVGVGLDKVLLFILPIVSVKIYGAEIHGDFIYSFTVSTILAMIIRLGMDNGILYFIPSIGNKYVSGIFITVTLFSIPIFILYYYIIDVSIIRYIPFVLMLAYQQILFALHRYYGFIKEYYIINSLFNYIFIIGFMVILQSIWTNNAIYLSYLTGYLFGTVVLFVYNSKYFERPRFSKDILIYSVPLMVTSGMGYIMNQIDIIMIKFFLDSTSVSIYHIASQFATLPIFFLVVFNVVFAPRISKLYNDGQFGKLKELYVKSSRYLIFLSLLLTVCVLFCRNYILAFFGEGFLSGEYVIIFRSIGQLVNNSVGSVWVLLSMTGKSKLNMWGIATGALVNVILNYFFIQWIGINGAAIASMIAVILSSSIGYLFVKRYINVKLFKYI